MDGSVECWGPRTSSNASKNSHSAYLPWPLVSLLSRIFLCSAFSFLILSLHCSRVREKPTSRKLSAIFLYTELFLRQPSSCSWITSSLHILMSLNVSSRLQFTTAIIISTCKLYNFNFEAFKLVTTAPYHAGRVVSSELAQFGWAQFSPGSHCAYRAVPYRTVLPC